MQAGEWIACLGMIELSNADRFPIDKIVAGKAVLSQAPFVLILVAGHTCGRNSEVSTGQILDFDGCAFLRRDMRWVVALVAGESRVFPLKHVAGIFVIEGFGVPLDERKVFAVVLRVTSGALLARSWRNVVAGVKALARR